MSLCEYLCWQELEQLGLDDSVDLHVCEVPVEYQAVQKLLPSLWREHQPQVCEKTHDNVHLTKQNKAKSISQSKPACASPLSGLLPAVSGPRRCVGGGHHRHSGAVRPQQRLPPPGQLQLLPSLPLLHRERPRLHPLTPGHERRLHESQRLGPRGHSLRVRGRWEVSVLEMSARTRTLFRERSLKALMRVFDLNLTANCYSDITLMPSPSIIYTLYRLHGHFSYSVVSRCLFWEEKKNSLTHFRFLFLKF